MRHLLNPWAWVLAFAALAAAYTALQIRDEGIRKEGEARLSNELTQQDNATRTEKANRDAEIRNEADDDLLDRFAPRGVPDGT